MKNVNEFEDIAFVDDEAGFEGAEVDQVEDANDIDSVDDEAGFEGPEVDQVEDANDIDSVDEDAPEPDDDEEDEYVDVDELLEQDAKEAAAAKALSRKFNKYFEVLKQKLSSTDDEAELDAIEMEYNPIGLFVNEIDGNTIVETYVVTDRPAPKVLSIRPVDDSSISFDIKLKNGFYRSADSKSIFELSRTAITDEEE